MMWFFSDCDLPPALGQIAGECEVVRNEAQLTQTVYLYLYLYEDHFDRTWAKGCLRVETWF